ncbi:RNA-binding protein 12 [Plakobranchus ocellatus]|uniref:RNA-binding protein 12 n=1 Tax=Plakobranchus ocellatus TaxID=259542 RepID=A0AAV4A975_9GAST|nr:RNA-binding protein 12 [Plakobranchus ocellatus]
MSVIIRLQGLPWSASAMNIRHFFSGLSIPAGGVHIIGGEGGDAFIAFSSDDDARMAMKKNMCTLNDTPIQLFLSSKAEMQSVIDAARSGVSSSAASTTQVSQSVSGIISNTATNVSDGNQIGLQQQRPNFPHGMPSMSMEMPDKNNMQLSNDFGSQMQQNQWQNFPSTYRGSGIGDSGDAAHGANQGGPSPMMGQPQHEIGGYSEGGMYQFTKAGDNQIGGRNYNQQGMGAVGPMNQQGRGINQGPIGAQEQRGNYSNYGQSERESQIKQGQSATNINQGTMGFGNIRPPGDSRNQQARMPDHMTPFVNQHQMGGPRPMGINQREGLGSLQGNAFTRPPFNQGMSLDQNQGLAGRQGIGNDMIAGMNRPNLPFSAGLAPEPEMGMKMPVGSENQMSGDARAMREFSNINQKGFGENVDKTLFPRDMTAGRVNEDKITQSNLASENAIDRPFPRQSGMHGANQRPGMPPSLFSGGKVDDDLMPSTSYPPDDHSMDPENESRMQRRFLSMQGYNQGDSKDMHGNRFTGPDEFRNKDIERSGDRFPGYGHQFSMGDHRHKRLPGERDKFHQDTDPRIGAFGRDGDRFPPSRAGVPEDHFFNKDPGNIYPPQSSRFRDREEAIRREAFARDHPNSSWARQLGSSDGSESSGQLAQEKNLGDRRVFRNAAEGPGSIMAPTSMREPGRRGPSRWDTTKEDSSESTTLAKSSEALPIKKLEEGTAKEGIVDKDQRTGSVEKSNINAMAVDGDAKSGMPISDVKTNKPDDSRAGSQGRVGPASEGRGSVEYKDESTIEGKRSFLERQKQGFDVRGPHFEGRRPEFERSADYERRERPFEGRGFEERSGFEGRRQGFERRGADFESRDLAFKGRLSDLEVRESEHEGLDPGFEERRPAFEGRRPGFEGRGQGFEGRGPGFEGRGPGFEGRGPGFEGRGPGYEGRGPGFEGRGPGYEGRGPGFEGRGPGFEGRGPGFEGRGPGFEGRGAGFEGRAREMESRGMEFEGRRPEFEGRRPEFEGRGPGFERRGPPPDFEGRRGDMAYENRDPGFERMDMEGRALEREGEGFNMRPGERSGFERRDIGFEGRQARFGLDEEENRIRPPFDIRGPRFEGRGPAFDARRGPGFEAMHEMDMDRRREDPNFDGRETEGNTMGGLGLGRGGPGMRGRGSDSIRGRGGMEMMSRGRGFSEETFDYGHGRPSAMSFGEGNMEDFDSRIHGRGGPFYERNFRGRGDSFFRGRGGPPGPFGRGRGMDMERYEDVDMLDVDARNLGGRPDGPPMPPRAKGLLGDAPVAAEENAGSESGSHEEGHERKRGASRSDSSSRRGADNSLRRSYERDRDRERDRRYDDRRGRDRDDRRHDDRSRYRFVRDRARRSRSRSRDRSRDRNSSTGKSGSPRTRTETRNRSICVKNMPLTVNYKEVRRFLQPLDIPYDGLKIINDEKGKRVGVAYVQLRRSDDVQRALRRSGEKIGSSAVTITACSDEEFSKAIDSYVPPKKDTSEATFADVKLPLSQNKDKPINPEKVRYVGQLKNLPQSVTKQDIVQFFKGVAIDNSGESIYIEFDESGLATGVAIVEYKSDTDYKKALTFDGTKMGSNIVRVSPGKVQEADDLKGKQLEMLQRAALRNASGPRQMVPQDQKMRPGLMGPRPDQPQQQNKPSTSVTPNQPNQVRPLGAPQATGNVRPPTPQQKTQPSGGLQTQQQPSQTASPAKGSPQEESQKSIDTVCVHIQGLPLLATPQDIRMFFGESQIAQRGINIAHDSRGKPLGEGFVEFRGRADFDKALKKDKTSLGRHIVAVKAISKKEMLERLGISHKASQLSQNKPEEAKKDQSSGQGLLSTHVNQNTGSSLEGMPHGPPQTGVQAQNGAQHQQRAAQPQQPQPRPKPLMSSPVPGIVGKGHEMQSVTGPGSASKSIPPGVLNQNWFYVRCQNFPPDISIAEILHFFQGFRPLGHSIRLHYSSDGTPTGNAVVGFGSREEAQRALGSLNMKRCRQNVINLFPA